MICRKTAVDHIYYGIKHGYSQLCYLIKAVLICLLAGYQCSNKHLMLLPFFSYSIAY